ncbi:MAG TPA: EAL domain-containing protein [Gemmataceae bacterium]|jgi:EAL domain-containing protein (putative c-di-GMP-specific phosphodiesterase class I)|nr:EAL domain-containing protein [Gemmataceae bacterium]
MQDLLAADLDLKTAMPYLEHFPENDGVPQRIPLMELPFRLGRNPGLDFTVYSSQVSKEHAEIVWSGKEYHIRDLGSTNGTFVNGRRVIEAPLSPGDILHLARKEFRFGVVVATPGDTAKMSRTMPAMPELPASLIQGSEHLRELIKLRKVRVVFQPIVHMETQNLLGYEALGRSTHGKLATNPAELFQLADQCRLAPELSRLFRNVAVEESAALPRGARIFLNLHPSEKLDAELVESARVLQQKLRRGQVLVLEVHEDMVTDLETLRTLRGRLRELKIEMAYDDFGAGQARLEELAEASPDYVKLHMRLIRGIQESRTRQGLIQALNKLGQELGVKQIAEGIETPEEAKVCRSLGCRFGQGFLFGRPQAAALMKSK